MNHCLRCHRNFSPGDRHIWNCDGVSQECKKCPSDEKKSLLEKIYKYGTVKQLDGLFRDDIPSPGYIDIEKTGKDQNGYTWVHGYSYPYKLNVDPKIQAVCTVFKRVIMEDIRFFLRHPLSFRKKEEIDRLVSIYRGGVEQKIDNIQFHPAIDELHQKAIQLTKKKIPLKGLARAEYETQSHDEPQAKVLMLIKASAAFFQTSTSYFTILSDLLQNVRTENEPRKEILRLLDLATKRYRRPSSRIPQVRKLAAVVLLHPTYKRIAGEYLKSLDTSKLKKDEADTYITYRRSFYDSDGLTWEERYAKVKEIDKKKGHVIFE